VAEDSPDTRKVVIIGTGCLGRDAMGLLQSHNDAGMKPRWELLGFLTPAWTGWGEQICGVPVLGPENLIADQEEHEGVAAICALDDPRERRQIVRKLSRQGIRFLSVLHPSVQKSGLAEVGAGCIMFPGVVLGVEAHIGDHVVVHANASVGPGAIVEDFATIGPGARVCGVVVVGEAASVGANSVVAEGGKVGRGSIVAPGAVVVDAAPDNARVAGAPARVVERLPQDAHL